MEKRHVVLILKVPKHNQQQTSMFLPPKKAGLFGKRKFKSPVAGAIGKFQAVDFCMVSSFASLAVGCRIPRELPRQNLNSIFDSGYTYPKLVNYFIKGEIQSLPRSSPLGSR